MCRVTLLGVPEDLARDLTLVLLAERHQVNRKRFIQELGRWPNSNAVFISGDDPDFRAVIRLVRQDWPDLPVIVVTRLPETAHWLDALEAGANDYCGAPFERIQVRCLLNAVLRSQQPLLSQISSR